MLVWVVQLDHNNKLALRVLSTLSHPLYNFLFLSKIIDNILLSALLQCEIILFNIAAFTIILIFTIFYSFL